MTKSIDFGFKPRPASSPADELAALWRRARLAVENAPACPCHGLVAGRVDADAMEVNVLTPLRSRYRNSKESDGEGAELFVLIEKRLRKSPFAGLRQPFEQWLRGLSNTQLSAAASETLIGDLRAALTYHAEAQPQFACE